MPFNLDTALRTPGAILLMDKRAIAARLDLEPRRAESADGGILGRLARVVGLKADHDSDRNDAVALPAVGWAADIEPAEGYVIVDGVAILDIAGILTRQGYYDFWSDCMVAGYEEIGGVLRRAQADDRVRGVFMRVDSPGGFSDGCFELAADIRAMSARNGGKPIWAHTWMACSAAYALASAADRIIASASADVGSIGVYVMLLDASEWLKTHGVRIEAIQSGSHKTSGGYWKPLTDDERADFQAVVDQIAREFVAGVTAGRPALTGDAIRAQEARWYLADHADPERSGLALGLVDAIASERDAFAQFLSTLTATAGTPGAADPISRADDKETAMTLAEQLAALKTKAAGGVAAAKSELAALAALLDPKAEGDDEKDAPAAAGDEDDEDDEEDDAKEPEASATGATAGFALLATPEAKGREALARHLGQRVASKKMTFGEARATLTAAPKSNRLSEAMANRDMNPGAGDGDRRATGDSWSKSIAKQNARVSGRR